MTAPDPLKEARKRIAGFLEEEKYYQDMLPGAEHWCEDCAPDYGSFEYGDDDERILFRNGNRGRG